MTIKAREVITSPAGILAIMNGTAENENAMAAAFFNGNQSEELKVGHQKILIDPSVCPKGGKKISNPGGRDFCIVRVEQKDITHYGQVVSGIWKKAWAERTLLPQVAKPQAEGICTLEAEKVEEPLYSNALQVRFKPTFTLKTKTAPKSDRYTVAQMKRIFQNSEETPAVDPARCHETESSFKAQINGQKFSMKLYISGRPHYFAPVYGGINEAVGMRDLPSLAHISYEDGTTAVHHVNLK